VFIACLDLITFAADLCDVLVGIPIMWNGFFGLVLHNFVIPWCMRL
jgi:hypothetical protein